MEKEFESRSDRAMRLAKIFWKSRAEVGVSQDFLAMELGVSKKTIQNWERGVSSPSLFQGMEWFRVLGINPLPYYLAYIFPDEMDGISPSDDDERIEKAIMALIEQLPIDGKRKLLYLLWGGHGSSPAAVIDLMTAHLHVPMKERMEQAAIIARSYEINEALNEIVCTDHVKPNMNKLWMAINEATSSLKEGKNEYDLIDVEPKE